MEHIKLIFVREGMMTTFLLWRRSLHAKKKGFIDVNEEKKGTVYGAGLF